MFERIDVSGSGYVTARRLKVPGGWLVEVIYTGQGEVRVAMLYITDTQHAWDLDSKWQRVNASRSATVQRLKVPGGWLVNVLSQSRERCGAMLYVSDTQHTWDPDPNAGWEKISRLTAAEKEMQNMPGWEPRPSISTDRMKVPGGWIVTTTAHGHRETNVSAMFVQDVRHEWKLE